MMRNMIRRPKFNPGDLVRITDDLGPMMSHFSSGCEAVVGHSDDSHEYSLHLKGGGTSAWYEEEQLTLIKKNQHHLIEQWAKESAKGKFIAYEYDDDDSINDEGCLRDTLEEAWEAVSDVFYAPCVLVEEVDTGKTWKPLVNTNFVLSTTKVEKDND